MSFGLRAASAAQSQPVKPCGLMEADSPSESFPLQRDTSNQNQWRPESSVFTGGGFRASVQKGVATKGKTTLTHPGKLLSFTH